MSCSEIHEYLFAFLDNELDGPLSIELQRHLERCHDCAREAEIERTIRRQLGCALEPGSAELLDEETLRQTVERVTALGTDSPTTLAPQHTAGAATSGRFEPAPTRAGRYPRRALVAGIAAALVMAPVLWFAFSGASSGAANGRLVDLFVADFEHFLEEGKQLQIESSDRRAVAEWLGRKTALAVVLPVSTDPRCKLMGGRKCKIQSRPAAFAVYEMDGVPASLVVVNGKPGELEGMERVVHKGQTHWVGQRRGHTVMACVRDQLVYAAVSTLPAEKLRCLMANVE